MSLWKCNHCGMSSELGYERHCGNCGKPKAPYIMLNDNSRIATIAKWRKANVVGSWCGISGCPCRAYPVTARTSQEMYAGIREHIEYVRSEQSKAQVRTQ